MVFTSSIFLFGFLPITLFLYFVVFRFSRKLQNLVLTLVSLFFYAWGEPVFVLIMIGSILANWAFALWIDKVRDNAKLVKLALTLTVVENLTILFIFKYLGFVLKNASLLINGNADNTWSIALPIGISFFTFQAMSYVFDVHRKNGAVQKNPINVALYVSFFPQLIAGPIVRYETIAEQINNRKETFDDFYIGVKRFIIGFAKKLLIANNLANVADAAFADAAPSVVMCWIGALAYAFQIFYDFSAYSDMAIGLGKMFGFHFLENFDYPYISKSISEFWRRWHISLGTWFRDYVYFPLGGSRVDSKARLVFNLFVVWGLTGLWHGANWTFIIWGLMYFVLIALEKVTGFDKKLGAFGHIYSMFFVLIGWVLFRANTLTDTVLYLQNMFGLGSGGLLNNIDIFYLKENAFFFLFAILFSLPVASWLGKKVKDNQTAAIAQTVLVLLLFLISISYMVKGLYNPFIYFNF